MKSLDEKYMQQAISLALRGRGYVNPNPMVGAIIVKDDEVVGEGWHEKYGTNHAEVNAIIDSGLSDFSDCTMYITLEPCSHQGKNPPCADKIVDLKFKRVVIGTSDPNPLVSGQGVQKLLEAGISVEVNVLKEKCDWLNRAFFKFITQNQPYITVKVAQSIDGCIATSSGESKWISSEESRVISHKLRASVDAILVGIGTAEADNPKLNVRELVGRDPLRVVLDSDLRMPLHLNIVKDENRQATIVFCSKKVANTPKANTLKVSGVKVEAVDVDDNSFADLNQVIEVLKTKYSVSSLLVEGGNQVLSSFMKYNLVDEMQVFIAPIIIGNGKHSFGGFELKYLKNAPNFEIRAINKSGKDIHLVATKV